MYRIGGTYRADLPNPAPLPQFVIRVCFRISIGLRIYAWAWVPALSMSISKHKHKQAPCYPCDAFIFWSLDPKVFKRWTDSRFSVCKRSHAFRSITSGKCPSSCQQSTLLRACIATPWRSDPTSVFPCSVQFPSCREVIIHLITTDVW